MTGLCTRCHEITEVSVHTTRTRLDGSKYTRYICKPCRRARYHKSSYRFSGPAKCLEQIVAEGVESNLRLMRKYARSV